MQIASKVAESLGLVDYKFEDWTSHLRFNNYHFTNEAVSSSAVHIHTDSSFITILQEDEEGLQVLDSNGNFVAIDPAPDTFLVFVGDIGKAWSNGRLHNVKHRVMCMKAIQRITIVHFLLSPKDGKIEPHPKFIDSTNPRLYDTFAFGDYRKHRASYGLKNGETMPLVIPQKDGARIVAEKKI